MGIFRVVLCMDCTAVFALPAITRLAVVVWSAFDVEWILLEKMQPKFFFIPSTHGMPPKYADGRGVTKGSHNVIRMIY